MLKRRTKVPSLETPDLLDLAHRAKGLDNGEILDAVDITLSNLGRFTSEFRRSRESDYLGEISMGAQALYVMAEEMATRAGFMAPTTPTRQRRSTRSYD